MRLLQRIPLCLSIISIICICAPATKGQVAPSGTEKADELYAAKDYAAAVPLYRKAAEAGQPHAMTQLGLCYDLGHGVKNDNAEAMRWYRKAAAVGGLDATAYIGGLYADGGAGPIITRRPCPGTASLPTRGARQP